VNIVHLLLSYVLLADNPDSCYLTVMTGPT